MRRTLFSWTFALLLGIIAALLAVPGWNKIADTDEDESVNINGTGFIEDPRSLPRLENPVIIIDKSQKYLYIYDNQLPVARFPVSIGAKKGDKYCEGDKRTPVGRFYVCLKNPNSKYVLSLGLSYPNIEDAERGLMEGLVSRKDYERIVAAIRNRGIPPWDTALGGEIMIHGKRDGGRPTLGCIALEDEAIRAVYREIAVGTPVIIKQ